jgi:hypothetical protein
LKTPFQLVVKDMHTLEHAGLTVMAGSLGLFAELVKSSTWYSSYINAYPRCVRGKRRALNERTNEETVQTLGEW